MQGSPEVLIVTDIKRGDLRSVGCLCQAHRGGWWRHLGLFTAIQRCAQSTRGSPTGWRALAAAISHQGDPIDTGTLGRRSLDGPRVLSLPTRCVRGGCAGRFAAVV